MDDEIQGREPLFNKKFQRPFGIGGMLGDGVDHLHPVHLLIQIVINDGHDDQGGQRD
jgi:hypothetical protein